MAEQFDKIIKAERQIKNKIEQAYNKRDALLAKALEEGTIEANKIKEQTDNKIQEILLDKKTKLAETDEKLANVVKKEEEKIAKKVSTKTNKIVEQIFKEALSDD